MISKSLPSPLLLPRKLALARLQFKQDRIRKRTRWEKARW